MAASNQKKPDAPAAPPPPPKKPVGQAVDPIAATGVKAGFDPLRPFRYVLGFATGTVKHGLDGISSGARRGMLWGALIAVGMAFVAPAMLPALMATNVAMAALVGAVAGGTLGGVLGGTVGTITGGAKGVNRLRRAEKYAEDLVEKQKSKEIHRTGTGLDYSDYYRAHRARTDFVTDRVRQIEAENRHDMRTYWQDRVQGGRGGMGGWGQGF